MERKMTDNQPTMFRDYRTRATKSVMNMRGRSSISFLLFGSQCMTVGVVCFSTKLEARTERETWTKRVTSLGTHDVDGSLCGDVFVVAFVLSSSSSSLVVGQIDSLGSRLTPQPRESLEKSLHPEGAHRHVASANDRYSFTVCDCVHVCSRGRSSLRMCDGTRQTREEKAKRSEH